MSSTRTHRRQPPRHHREETSHDEDVSRMVSSDEKGALILAHHHARQKNAHPKGWGAGYYIGIAASCLVIITGWWMTLGTNLRSDVRPGPDEATQILETNLQKFRDGLPTSEFNQGKDAINANIDVMKQEYNQNVVQQRAFEDVAKKIQEMSTSTQP